MSDEGEKRLGKSRISPESSSPLSSSREHSPKGIFKMRKNATHSVPSGSVAMCRTPQNSFQPPALEANEKGERVN